MQPRRKATGYRLQATGRNQPSALQASHLQSQTYVRRGISLLEVLISMFILLVGLLGVGALIPVGKLEVSQADQYDRASAVGRAAFREIKIRGMLRADAGCLNGYATATPGPVPMWLNYNAYSTAGGSLSLASINLATNTTTAVPVQDANGIVYGDGLPVTAPASGGGGGGSPSYTTPPMAYCLDPWGMAFNYNAGVTTPSVATFPANIESVSVTPYTQSVGTSGLNYMTRITLLTATSLTIAQMANGGATGQLPSGGPMTLGMAEHIFHAEDDLVVNVPGTNNGASVALGATMGGNASAIQQFFPTGSGMIPQKRLSDGNYSWMATIVPNSPTLAYSNKAEPFNNQQYTVSVVVFYKRPVLLSTPMNKQGPTTFYPERYATVTQFGGIAAGGMSGSAISGGEVTLQAPTPSSGYYDPGYLNIKRGQWILLAGQSHVYLDPTYGQNPPGAAPTVWIYRWYRVVAADDVVDTSNVVATSGSTAAPFHRNVTLVGPDWPAHAIAGNTFAVICDGVVGVYEKVMNLERTSVWSQQ